MNNNKKVCTNPELGNIINDFIDGELTEEQMCKVEQHIFIECEACLDEYQFHIDLTATLREAHKKGLIKLKVG